MHQTMRVPLWRSRNPWVQAVSLTISTKLFLMLIGVFANAVLAANPVGGFKRYPMLLNIWTRWDSAWFVRVADQGYAHGTVLNASFFPLYPGLMHFFGLIFPHVSPYDFAVGISWAFDVPLFFWLIQLARLDFGPRVASEAARQLAVYPLAFFLSVAYSEAPFIALVLGAFYLARKEAWWLSALLACLAALTRNEGVFLVFPLAWEFYKQRGFRWHPNALALLGAPVGLLAFMAYLQVIGRGAFDFMKAEALGWNRITVTPWRGVHVALSVLHHNPLSSLPFIYTFIDLGSAVMLGVGIVVMFRLRYRWSYIMWCAILVLIPLMSVANGFLSPLRSTSRLILPAFPLYFLLAQVSRRNRWWRQVTSLWFPGLQALFFTFWVLSFWIA